MKEIKETKDKKNNKNNNKPTADTHICHQNNPPSPHPGLRNKEYPE